MNQIKGLSGDLLEFKTQVYEKCGFSISNFELESESKEYSACRFVLNRRLVLCRNAKTTPKKSGQFVTFWNRVDKGPIAPFHASDSIDFFVINVRTENRFGQFVFPKSVLVTEGILSTKQKEGKRAFRVYPPWDSGLNKQAQRTQLWQVNYFFEVDNSIDLSKVVQLYAAE